jgi:hypothetical protein
VHLEGILDGSYITTSIRDVNLFQIHRPVSDNADIENRLQSCAAEVSQLNKGVNELQDLYVLSQVLQSNSRLVCWLTD